MRCIAVALAYALIFTSASAQTPDYNKNCPKSYAFNYAGLEWYDTVLVQWVSVGSGGFECNHSDPGYYFGYNPSTNPALGAVGPTEADCKCKYVQAPQDIMRLQAPKPARDVPVRVIAKGLYRRDGSSLSDLDILFDKLVVRAKDGQGQQRYFLCLAAFRKLDMQQARPISGHQIRIAVEITKPENYTIVDGVLSPSTGANAWVLSVGKSITLGDPNGLFQSMGGQIKFDVSL